MIFERRIKYLMYIWAATVNVEGAILAIVINKVEIIIIMKR
jgi:hypothetical protein